MTSNQTKLTFLVLILIIIMGSGLRFYGLDRSLWLDEVLSVASQSDFQRHLSNIYLPMHLYFVVLHIFTYFGTSEIVLRLPSFIFGILSIILMYKIGKLFFGRLEGLIGAFLLSISTILIRHSQEARYYSLSAFLSLLSFFFLFKAVKEHDRKLWVGFFFSTILAVLSHYYMIFIVLIEVIFLGIMFAKYPKSFILGVKKIGKAKIVLLLFGLLIISVFSFPIIQNILNQFLSGSGYAGQATFGIPPESFFQDLFSNFSFGYSFSYFTFLSGTLAGTLFLFVFFLFLLMGLVTSAKNYNDQTILLVLWIFLPAMIIYFLSVSLNSALIDAKYLIFIIPSYLLCISKGISSISSNLLKYYYRCIFIWSSFCTQYYSTNMI
ncbi:MAG: glycosyltransferase family 39 protein [Candidatus Bathyarchaeota archaeon]